MPSVERIPTFRQVSIDISRWFLSDGSETWLDSPQAMVVWDLAVFSLLATTAGSYLARVLFESALSRLPLAAFVFRCSGVAIVAWLLALEAALAVAHYRHLVLTGLDLRFKSVFLFWLNWVTLFAILYGRLFALSPHLFFYPNPVVKYSAVVVPIRIVSSCEELACSLVYSAATALATTVPYMGSSSPAVSAMNVIETAGSLLLTAVFVATLVGGRAKVKAPESAGPDQPEN